MREHSSSPHTIPASSTTEMRDSSLSPPSPDSVYSTAHSSRPQHQAVLSVIITLTQAVAVANNWHNLFIITDDSDRDITCLINNFSLHRLLNSENMR